MEAQMRVAHSLNSKSAARLELFARQHRSRETESEAALWSALRAGQLGVSFRRQVPVAGLFIADFLAPSIKQSSKSTAPYTRASRALTRAEIASYSARAFASCA
jgi:Protein of unknown function (DUF559)